jgi:hypothetical protein
MDYTYYTRAPSGEKRAMGNWGIGEIPLLVYL